MLGVTFRSRRARGFPWDSKVTATLGKLARGSITPAEVRQSIFFSEHADCGAAVPRVSLVHLGPIGLHILEAVTRRNRTLFMSRILRRNTIMMVCWLLVIVSVGIVHSLLRAMIPTGPLLSRCVIL